MEGKGKTAGWRCDGKWKNGWKDGQKCWCMMKPWYICPHDLPLYPCRLLTGRKPLKRQNWGSSKHFLSTSKGSSHMGVKNLPQRLVKHPICSKLGNRRCLRWCFCHSKDSSVTDGIISSQVLHVLLFFYRQMWNFYSVHYKFVPVCCLSVSSHCAHVAQWVCMDLKVCVYSGPSPVCLTLHLCFF